jgi:hypothetical protein
LERMWRSRALQSPRPEAVARVVDWEEAMVEEREEERAEGLGEAVGTERVEAAMGMVEAAMEMEMGEVARTSEAGERLEEGNQEVEAGGCAGRRRCWETPSRSGRVAEVGSRGKCTAELAGWTVAA